MATLDEKDTQTMADLLAKLGIEGEVSSLKDLQALVKPKKATNQERNDFLWEHMKKMMRMILKQLLQWFPSSHGSVGQHQSQRSCLIHSLET